MTLTRRGKIALTVAGCTLAGIAGYALPVHAAPTQNERLEYYRVTMNNPTPIDRLVIRGGGCLDAEDMTTLKLVEYAPSSHKVIYRCIQP